MVRPFSVNTSVAMVYNVLMCHNISNHVSALIIFCACKRCTVAWLLRTLEATLQQYCNGGQLMSGQRVRVEAGEQHFCVMQNQASSYQTFSVPYAYLSLAIFIVCFIRGLAPTYVHTQKKAAINKAI